jgi:ABC-type Fe3+/spermidine/putrescine transport system ATPase subunit
MNPLVEFDNVSMNYGDTTVLREVSFTQQEGDHLAVLGASGSGKSTILSLLAGLLHPSTGRIFIAGETVSKTGAILVPPHRRGLAMVFQDLALWPNLNALQNVLMGIPRCSGMSRSGRLGRATEMLSTCGIGELASRKPAMMSSGQQQRVALARALAARPRLLLLDEPFTGLDLEIKQRLLDEIRSLAEQFGITLILVSHDPWEIRCLCQSVIVLQDHGIREHGRFDDLLVDPGSTTMQAIAVSLTRSGG